MTAEDIKVGDIVWFELAAILGGTIKTRKHPAKVLHVDEGDNCKVVYTHPFYKKNVYLVLAPQQLFTKR